MSYGYDSSVAFSKSEIGLGDVAADLLNRLDEERYYSYATALEESWLKRYVNRLTGMVHRL